jgi:uncharacterized membrane protein
MLNLGARLANRRTLFGDAALLLFLFAQASDGVLTYVGVATYGTGIEGNPLITWLMHAMGEGPALTTAKAASASFGIALHLSSVHNVVAALAAFSLAFAVLPWMALLFVL